MHCRNANYYSFNWFMLSPIKNFDIMVPKYVHFYIRLLKKKIVLFSFVSICKEASCITLSSICFEEKWCKKPKELFVLKNEDDFECVFHSPNNNVFFIKSWHKNDEQWHPGAVFFSLYKNAKPFFSHRLIIKKNSEKISNQNL